MRADAKIVTHIAQQSESIIIPTDSETCIIYYYTVTPDLEMQAVKPMFQISIPFIFSPVRLNFCEMGYLHPKIEGV